MTTHPSSRAIVPLLLSLFSLRMLYLGAGRLITWPSYPAWLLPSHQIATYILIAILFYVCRDRLAHFHITHLALWLFLLAPVLNAIGVLLTRFRLPTMDWIVIFTESATAIALSIALSRRKPARTSLGHDTSASLLVAAAIGAALGLIFGSYYLLQRTGRLIPPDSPHPLGEGALVLVSFAFMQLSGAAVLEEPLFRGLAWGALRDWQWKDIPILFFQATLFLLAHVYYIRFAPFSLWIIVPVMGLVLGAIACRTRSIATAMIAHALANAAAIYWGRA